MKKRIIFISVVAILISILFLVIKIASINLINNAVIVMDTKSKYTKDKNSYLYNEPVLRTISSQTNNRDKDIIRYDKVTFSIPWSDFTKKKEYEGSLGVFSDKESISVYKKKESIENILKETVDSKSIDEFLKFDNGILKDEYKLQKNIYE
ncbi:hypothetical protein [Acetivibrio cellulolyticus]|uniref:hypothetical protein n=1 Tax=Acetivibrio cellulolyticus TaxID=35830 RepID=UPI0001E3019B|nr:hypothetical protein [Acetivibrio cellulolyticus]